MSTATLAGLLLIVMPAAFNVAFGMLAARSTTPTFCAALRTRC
jgi:hypothetical protein